MSEKLRIEGNVGVAVNAENGSAVHIHLAELEQNRTMTENDDFLIEAANYRQFKKLTGIRASKIERTALTWLVTEHPVSFRQACICWNSGNLFYRDGSLQVKESPVESVVAGIFAALCLVNTVTVMLVMNFASWDMLLLRLFIKAGLYLVIAMIAFRYFVAPTLLARRIGRFLRVYGD